MEILKIPRGARLTDLAHETVSAVLRPGDWAVDATAGNGHDTLFLAQAVAPSGRVDAFDIQADALAKTAQRLCDARLSAHLSAHLHHRGHESMQETLGPEATGAVRAILFNLGYLPGGPRSTTTHCETTLQAITQAIELLAPGGCLSILAYVGHPGGRNECEAVLALLEAHTAKNHELTARHTLIDDPMLNAPELIVVQRATATV